MELYHIIIESILIIAGILAVILMVRSFYDLKASRRELQELKTPKNPKNV